MAADQIQNLGFGQIVLALLNSTNPMIKYGGWGTGAAVATSATDITTRAAPTTTTGVAGTPSQVTTTQTGDTYQVVTTITASGTVAITEFGLWSGTSTTLNSDVLTEYHNFAALNLVSGDSLQATTQMKLQ